MLHRAAVVLLLIPAVATAAEVPTIDLALAFGKPAPIEQLKEQNATRTGGETIVAFDPATTELTPIKAGAAQVTFAKADGTVLLIANVTVNPIPIRISLTRDDEALPFTDDATPIPVVTGDIVDLAVTKTDADGTSADAHVRIAPANFVTTDGKTLTFSELPNGTAINPQPTPVTVTLTTDDEVVHTLRFLLIEAIENVRVETPPSLRENTTTTIPITITGTGGGTYHSTSPSFSSSYQYDCTSDPQGDAFSALPSGVATLKLSAVDSTKLQSLPGKTAILRVTCSAHPVGSDREEESSPKDIRIEEVGRSIAFVPELLNVVAGQNATVRAMVRKRSGEPDPEARVAWSILEQTDAAVLTAGANNEATLVTLPDSSKLPANGVLTIRATVPNSDPNATAISADLVVRITSPSGFARVTGAIDMVDYRTAIHLYGTQTFKDYYVAQVTLMNRLQDEPDRKLVGASILVFSNSLEIGVNMEKTQAAGDKPPKRDARWEPVTFGDLRLQGLPVTYPVLSAQARPNIVLPLRDKDGNPLPHPLDNVPVYTCDDIWYAEQEIQLSPEQEMLPADQREMVRAKLTRARDAQVAAARLRQLHWRPYPYDTVVKSFDPRDAGTQRSLVFRALTFGGAVASFITGVPQFNASSEFVAINEKLGNVLVPALAGLWPSLKETQRQNLVSDTMHPIEEIPYASSLTKKIFLPKHPFPGPKRGYWFRISEVCLFNFHVDVAVAPKRTTETIAPAQPTPP